MELVFHLGTPFRRLGTDGILRPQETALLVGVTTRAVVLSPSERSNVIGVRFRPGGAAFLGGPPADRWTDVIAPLEALADLHLVELSERLASVGPGGERVWLLDAFLSERARAARGTPLVGAAASICRGVPIDAVAADCALSARQLQRRFRAEVGIGPKLLARIARFQRALRLGTPDTRTRPTSRGISASSRVSRRAGSVASSTRSRTLSSLAPTPLSLLFKRRRRPVNENKSIMQRFTTQTPGQRPVLVALAALLLFVVLLSGAQKPNTEEPADPLESLRWLAGHWALEQDSQYAEELWLPPRGGVMLGVGRTTVVGQAKASFEYLRIESRLDGVFYMASPGGGPATDFRLVESGEHRAVFANPDHDFPKRIVYERSEDELTARAEGDDGNVLTFRWKRIANVR
jgi:AraC-like DNA-binding protein